MIRVRDDLLEYILEMFNNKTLEVGFVIEDLTVCLFEREFKPKIKIWYKIKHDLSVFVYRKGIKFCIDEYLMGDSDYSNIIICNDVDGELKSKEQDEIRQFVINEIIKDVSRKIKKLIEKIDVPKVIDFSDFMIKDSEQDYYYDDIRYKTKDKIVYKDENIIIKLTTLG